MSKLAIKDSFETADLSDVEEDTIAKQSDKTRKILDKLGFKGKKFIHAFKIN